MSARRAGLAVLAVAALAACAGGKPAAADSSAPAAVAATGISVDTAGWVPLFDATLSRWRGWKSDSLVSRGWVITDSMISKDSVVSDLTTRTNYGNFELEFEWKVGAMGNAGVFYKVTDEYDKPYWSGPEYQLRDEAMDPEAKNLKLSSASVYGLYAPPAGLTKPLGEWNTARIVVKGDSVTHWLNGQQAVAYALGSPDFTTLVKAAKFGEYPNFGRAAKGMIAIQGDHNGSLGL
ncbi:MAG: DUF1080 domain-containing protein, partial [Gemmatimonadaceae bacterium]|nr:DUF1080 domain-containing protein [Gemmatimonadaceae bacterium]